MTVLVVVIVRIVARGWGCRTRGDRYHVRSGLMVLVIAVVLVVVVLVGLVGRMVIIETANVGRLIGVGRGQLIGLGWLNLIAIGGDLGRGLVLVTGVAGTVDLENEKVFIAFNNFN